MNKRLATSGIPGSGWRPLAPHICRSDARRDFTSAAIQTELPRLSDATRNKLTQLSDSYEMIMRDLLPRYRCRPEHHAV